MLKIQEEAFGNVCVIAENIKIVKMDRDLNASLNLKQIYRESSSRIYASGDGSSSNANLVSPSLNEEFNKKSRVYILKR
jgi:hypothetical protein